MGRIEGLRDDLASGDVASATKDLPACAAASAVPHPCLGELATAFGSKSGYSEEPPDQASAAALAVAIARDAKGSMAGHPDAWLKVIRVSKGAGPDALRVATALRVQSIARTWARAITTEDDARRFLKDVSALPGACNTYVDLAAGKDDATLPLTEQADHSPCVQRDLGRKFGPGGTYGFGLWRAVAGALALVKETADALEEGTKIAQVKVPTVKVSDLDAIKPKTVETPAANDWTQHAMSPPPLAPLSKDAGRD
jgi:hypothetical protein